MVLCGSPNCRDSSATVIPDVLSRSIAFQSTPGRREPFGRITTPARWRPVAIVALHVPKRFAILSVDSPALYALTIAAQSSGLSAGRRPITVPQKMSDRRWRHLEERKRVLIVTP